MADRGSAVNFGLDFGLYLYLKFGLWVLNEVRIIDLLQATAGMLVFYPPYFFFRIGPRLGKLGFCFVIGIVSSLSNMFDFIIDFAIWTTVSTSTSLPKNFYNKAKWQMC